MESTFGRLLSTLPTKIIYQESQYLFDLDCDHNFNWTASYIRDGGTFRMLRTVGSNSIRVLEVLHSKLEVLSRDYKLIY